MMLVSALLHTVRGWTIALGPSCFHFPMFIFISLDIFSFVKDGPCAGFGFFGLGSWGEE